MTEMLVRRGSPTGADAQRQLAKMKARAIARYHLATVPGRPEELVDPISRDTPGFPTAGISIQYGCRQVRVRLMEGRTWVSVHDFQIGRIWTSRLDHLLDAHFGGPAGTSVPAGFAVVPVSA